MSDPLAQKPKPDPNLDPNDYEFRVARFTLNEHNYGKLARLAVTSPLAKAARDAGRRRRKT